MRNAVLTGGAAYINIGAAGDTSYHYVRLIDNGNTSFYYGIDDSTGSFFGNGAYSRALYSEGSYPIGVYVGGAKKAEFTTAGNIAITNSGNGIDFSATPGTGTSELLNDYEEGTWTPTFTTTGTGFTAISYSAQTGVYTKIGNTVTVYFSITIASVTVGAASGAMVVGGMPFTASNGTGNTGFQTNFVTVGPDFMQFYGAGTNALLRYKAAGSWANVAPANAQAGLQLDGSMTYFV